MANNIKTCWAEGRAALNGWLAIPSGFAAEVMAQCGFDSLTVDLQHGVQDYHSMVACFQAAQLGGVTPMARVTSNEPGVIGKALDAGAYGVICPMVNTAKQAEAFVQACKYPPMGARSNGPVRPNIYAAPGAYQKTANEETLCLPMIETREAVKNLEAILDVEGVAGVYIGPSDLGFSYGYGPGMDREEPELLKLLEKVVKACGKRGLHAGLHNATAAYSVRAVAMGFRLVTIATDNALIAAGGRAAVATLRKGAKAAG